MRWDFTQFFGQRLLGRTWTKLLCKPFLQPGWPLQYIFACENSAAGVESASMSRAPLQCGSAARRWNNLRLHLATFFAALHASNVHSTAAAGIQTTLLIFVAGISLPVQEHIDIPVLSSPHLFHRRFSSGPELDIIDLFGGDSYTELTGVFQQVQSNMMMGCNNQVLRWLLAM